MLAPPNPTRLLLRLLAPLHLLNNLSASVPADLAAESRLQKIVAFKLRTLPSLQTKIRLHSPTNTAGESTTTFMILLEDLENPPADEVLLLPVLSAATIFLPHIMAPVLVCNCQLLFFETSRTSAMQNS